MLLLLLLFFNIYCVIKSVPGIADAGAGTAAIHSSVDTSRSVNSTTSLSKNNSRQLSQKLQVSSAPRYELNGHIAPHMYAISKYLPNVKFHRDVPCILVCFCFFLVLRFRFFWKKKKKKIPQKYRTRQSLGSGVYLYVCDFIIYLLKG